ncbi:MAG: hypothetical protein HFI72_07490 [Peptococcaceae bacterium]|nr:hypothetical protein [Peptococcaceae bacterium]
MQWVSGSYQPFSDSRRVGLGFSFGVIAPEAAAIAQPTSSPQAEYSQIEQTHDGIEKPFAKYATLEGDGFLLDNSFRLYPKADAISGLQTGWISSPLSDGNGVFGEDPYLMFSFAADQSSYGFTLIFDEHLPDIFATEIRITALDASENVLSQKTFYPDNWKFIADMAVMNYRKIRIDFLKTSKPFYRVKISEVVFGITYEYSSRNIVSADSKHAVSPWSETLPSGEVTVTIDNSNQLYNMVNPTGLYAYLQDGQTMDWFIEINGEKVSMGKQHFTDAKSNDGGLTATITFNDWLFLLDNVKYDQGTTGTWTLQEAVTSILGVSGLGVTAVFDAGCGETVINRCVPVGTSCREAIRLAAQAAKTCCYVDRYNHLHFIKPILGEKEKEITQDELAADAQIKVGQLYNMVKISVLDSFTEAKDETVYTAGTVGSEEIARIYEISNPLVRDGSCADWILAMLQRRVSYEFTYRGDPSLDLLDVLQVNDIYGVNDTSILIEHNFKYDGGLEADGTTIK